VDLRNSLRKRIPLYFSLVAVLLLLDGYLTIPLSLGLQGSQSILSHGTIRYSKLLKLRVEGTRIVDSLGSEVKLSGFNVHSKHIADPEAWQPNEDDIKWIKERGSNCIRVVVYWSDVEPTEGVYDESFFTDCLDPLISWCEKYGIYVVLDMHQWNWSPYWGGFGFPTWACDMYPQNDAGMEQCAVDFWKGQGVGSYTKQKFVDVWRLLSDRYKNRDVIAGYNVFTDPLGFYRGEYHIAELAPYVMELYNDLLTPAIRSVDPDTTIVYFMIYQNSQLDVNTKQTQPNVAWGRFWYEYSWDPYTGRYEEYKPEYYEEMKTYYAPVYKKVYSEFNAPLIWLEIGCDSTHEGNLLWVDDSLRCMEELAELYGGQGHFMWWRYGKGRSWAPRNEDGSDRPVVAILQKYQS
jgi:hypothetical protein